MQEFERPQATQPEVKIVEPVVETPDSTEVIIVEDNPSEVNTEQTVNNVLHFEFL